MTPQQRKDRLVLERTVVDIDIQWAHPARVAQLAAKAERIDKAIAVAELRCRRAEVTS